MVDVEHTPDAPLDVFVPLHEAAQAYDTSVGALRARIRAGGLRAYKVAGPHGREWRVSLRSLQAAGLPPRVAAPACAEERARVQELEAELTVVRRMLAGERRRADRADQELGHALLERGRLRSELSRAQDRAGMSAGQMSVPAGGGHSRPRDERDVPEPR